jgi:hypothetical protein
MFIYLFFIFIFFFFFFFLFIFLLYNCTEEQEMVCNMRLSPSCISSTGQIGALVLETSFSPPPPLSPPFKHFFIVILFIGIYLVVNELKEWKGREREWQEGGGREGEERRERRREREEGKRGRGEEGERRVRRAQ